MSDNTVFHFTDTCRLPWIITTKELRPGLNRIGGYPVDFLWATTSPIGDRTSSATAPNQIGAYRNGLIQLIRFTLHRSDFRPWREVVEEAGWKREHIDSLLKAAANMKETNIDGWLCRADPLPLDRIISVEAKAWVSNKWKPIDATLEYCIGEEGNPMRLGVVIGNQAYMATQKTFPNGQTGYANVACGDWDMIPAGPRQ